jgi:hypothetical protein
MIKNGKLKAVRLPMGKDGEIRINQSELDRVLGKKNDVDETKQ